VIKSPETKRENPKLNECIYKVKPKSIKNAPNAPRIGHGLGSTI
jgi:hypothetical protein